MNKQEIYDKAILHFLSMKEQCISGSRCSYMDYKGNSCIIGRLIDKNDADLWANKHNVSSIMYFIEDLLDPRQKTYLDSFVQKTKTKYPWLIDENNKNLLVGLQNIHDTAENWNAAGFVGYDELKALGIKHGLDTSKLKAKTHEFV